jgi:GNAT superfamily N-acetyltransferase
MREWDQHPLFRITPDQAALDEHLATAGYAVKDPVVLYVALVAVLDDGRDETVRVIRVGAPLAIVDEIWEQGGIGPGRRAVMERARGPRIMLMTRTGDRPAGVAFVAVDNVNGGDIAMIHAIEVAHQHRRKGAGETLLRGAASFARENGAAWLALAVTEANAPARALYERLGMVATGRSHYRVAPIGEG